MGAKPGGKAGDLADLPGPAEEGHGHDAEHGTRAEAGVAATRVGCLAQHLHQVAALGLGKRHLAAGDIHERRLVLGQERGGGGQLPGSASQFPQPQAFGLPVGDIKFRASPAASRAHARRLPAAGLVAGAVIGFRVGEAFRDQRLVAEVFPPLGGQRPTRCRQHRGGQVRLPPALHQKQEAPVLHHKLQALRRHRRVPPHPRFPVFELERGRPPHHQRHPLPVAFDDLPQKIPDPRRLPQIMLLAQQRIEALPLLPLNDPHC